MSHCRLRLSQGLVIALWVSTALNKHHMRFGARMQFELAVVLWLCLQETAWVQMSLDLKPPLFAWHEQKEYLFVSICSFMYPLGPIDRSNDPWFTKQSLGTKFCQALDCYGV